MNKYDFLIVGAGLYGATFARIMADSGKRCLVIDKREHIAGNIYTENQNGINVHKYGAHIFHTSDDEVWEFASRFTTFNRYTNSPIANYNGEIFSMPFNMYTFNKMWGVATPEEAENKLKQQRQEALDMLNGREPANLEEQAISLIGRDIYEKLVKGYTEKQWGRKATELPGFIIKRLPVRLTYDNNYFNDKYQGIPMGGYTLMVEKMLDSELIEVRLGVDYFLDSNRSELEACADKIIYTGMIDEFFDYCYGPLEYRSLKFETEVMPEVDNFQGNAVVNYTDDKTKYTRIIEHKHFEFNNCSGTVVTREYPSSWERGDEPYYPMNDEKNNELYQKYSKLASKKSTNVFFGGRLGKYKYYDMDDVILEAMKDARLFN